MSYSTTECTNVSSARLTAISIHECIVKACFFYIEHYKHYKTTNTCSS